MGKGSITKYVLIIPAWIRNGAGDKLLHGLPSLLIRAIKYMQMNNSKNLRMAHILLA